MPTASWLARDGVPLVRLTSERLILDVAPSLGGRVVSVHHRGTGHEFLWQRPGAPLVPCNPGEAYDPAFWGGIDELLPNDIPEIVQGVALPDHGELWTSQLTAQVVGDTLRLRGGLPVSGLHYERDMVLADDAPEVRLRYTLTNTTTRRQPVMFKLHAAIAIAPGDEIVCPARRARVADPAWSRWGDSPAFAWPSPRPGARADVVPARDGSTDFLHLYELDRGEIAWRRPATGHLFRYRFDPAVFPCAWLFASYGGFDNHYTAILEPCTTMPMSVVEAARTGHCLILEPGATVTTNVTMFAGLQDEA